MHQPANVKQIAMLLKEMRQECRELQEEITEDITLLQDAERTCKGQVTILKQLREDISDVGDKQRGYFEPYKKEKIEQRLQRCIAILPA